MSLREKLNNPRLIKLCWKRIYWSKSISKKSRSKGIDNQSIQAFKSEEKKNLNEIVNLLEKNQYKFSSLFGFSVKKENNNEYRLITAATVKDRIVHKAILYLLNEKFYEYVNTGVSYCGVKKYILNRNTDENVLNTKTAVEKLTEHINNGHFIFFKSDIKGFYDNVPKRRLFNLVKRLSIKLLNDDSLNNFLHDVIFFRIGNRKQILQENKVSLPSRHYGISQGSALSQLFANIYLRDFDVEMKKIYGDRFIRYIDDFIIACKSLKEAQEARERAIKILRKKSLTLSPSKEKTKIVDIRQKDFNFLGLNFSKNQISWKRQNNEARKWLENVLNINNREYYGECKNRTEKLIKMNLKIQGIGEYLRYYHTKTNFMEINKQIKIKRRQHSEYNKIQLLDLNIIKPVIPESRWKALFS